jgi:predicted O-linked N-acetylglucosamine transferase (SPINDLY family)
VIQNPSTENSISIQDALDLQNAGKAEVAEIAFRQILIEQPNNKIAIYSLGVLLIGKEQIEEANQLFRHGCITSPDFAPNWLGFAMTCQKLGNWDQALRAYDEAIKADPKYVEALVDKGVLLRNMLRHHDSIKCFETALEINPDHRTALGNYAILLSEFKQVDKSIELFDRLHRLHPDHDYIAGLLIYERMHIADWTEYATLRDEIISGVRAGRKVCKSLPFMALSDSAEDQFKCGCIFANAYSAKPQGPLWKGEVYHHQKLRIAYVSPDLREHPVGHLMAGIFESHDKSRVETIAVSLGIDDRSRLRERILSTFDHVIEARGMASKKIAEQMHEMEVDIAIDLAGYTADSRTEIFSWRPAPVHVNFLGYAGTLGVEYMDYIIADRHVIPPEHQSCFTEKVLYMPDSYLPTDRNLQIAEETPTRAACGLPEEGVVFCSFSHDYKISPPLWRVWMSLLDQVPGSVLWLVARNEQTQKNFRHAAEMFGIAGHRLVFAGRVPRVEDHLARYRLADLFLDTWPYNAHTTAADALGAGLPVLTYMGGAFPARVAASLLHSIGLPEMITHSWADYEKLALDLVRDQPRLAALKARLRANKETYPLFDTKKFCRAFEDLLFSVAPAQ